MSTLYLQLSLSNNYDSSLSTLSWEKLWSLNQTSWRWCDVADQHHLIHEKYPPPKHRKLPTHKVGTGLDVSPYPRCFHLSRSSDPEAEYGLRPCGGGETWPHGQHRWSTPPTPVSADDWSTRYPNIEDRKACCRGREDHMLSSDPDQQAQSSNFLAAAESNSATTHLQKQHQGVKNHKTKTLTHNSQQH